MCVPCWVRADVCSVLGEFPHVRVDLGRSFMTAMEAQGSSFSHKSVSCACKKKCLREGKYF